MSKKEEEALCEFLDILNKGIASVLDERTTMDFSDLQRCHALIERTYFLGAATVEDVRMATIDLVEAAVMRIQQSGLSEEEKKPLVVRFCDWLASEKFPFEFPACETPAGNSL